MWKVFDHHGRFILKRDDGLVFKKLRGTKLVKHTWPTLQDARRFANALNLVSQ